MKLSATLVFLASTQLVSAFQDKLTDITVLDEDRYEKVNDFPLFNSSAKIKVLPGETYGGNAFIDINDPNYMFIIKNAETKDSQILHVPVSRDANYGHITEVDFASQIWVDVPETDNGYIKQAPALVNASYITQISTNVDPNGNWWYSTVCGNTEENLCNHNSTHLYYDPHQNCYGKYDAASDSFTTEGCIDDDIWKQFNLTYSYKNDEGTGIFTGFWGMNFTEDGTIVGTARYGLFEATMDWNTYTPLSVVQRCELTSIDYLGSLAHIPSGTYKDDLIIANYDDNEVSILRLNSDRTCKTDVDGTAEMLTLIDGLDAAWGVWFDPITNNFMANSWEVDYSDYVYQFQGFVPGVNQQTVYDNIDASSNRIYEALNGQRKRTLRRRELGKSKSKGKSKSEGKSNRSSKGKSKDIKRLKKDLVKKADTPEFGDLLIETARQLEESEYYERCLNNGENDPEAIESYIALADSILDAIEAAHAIILAECPSCDLDAALAEQVSLFTSLRNACTGQVVASNSTAAE